MTPNFLMQKYLRYSLLLLLLPNWSLAQEGENLVPNPGFEQMYSCPYSVAQLDRAVNWYSAMVKGSISTELFSSCVDTSANGGNPGVFDFPCSWFGCQNPKTGENYAGLGIISDSYSSALEFISSPLTQQLLGGEKYCIKMFVAHASTSKGISDGLNILFHRDSLLVPFDILSISIQGKQDSLLSTIASQKLTINQNSDTVSWFEIQSEYIAIGGEKYFSIGNFNTAANLHYTLFDSNQPPPLRRHYIYLDDISITHCPDPVVLPPYLKIYPNPTANRVTVATNALQADETARLELIDMFGRRVHNENLVYSNEGWELDLYGLQSGMYYLRFWVNGELRAAEKLVKSVPTSR